jgi:hypothetical protein
MAGAIAGVEAVGQYGDPKADSRLEEKEIVSTRCNESPVIVSVRVRPIGDWRVFCKRRQ